MKRLFILVLLTGLLCLSSVHAQDGGLSETFDNPELPGWERSPNASVVNGVLRVEPEGFAFHGGAWSDLTLSVGTRRTGGGFLDIRYSVSDSGAYFFGFGDEQLGLVHDAPDAPVELVIHPQPTPADEWVQVDIVVTGNVHTIMLNGQVVVSVTDPKPLPPGGVMLAAHNGAIGEFDDLTIVPGGEGSLPLESGEEGLRTSNETNGDEPSPSNAGTPAYQASTWVQVGGPPGGTGYDIRYNFADPHTWYVTDSGAGFFISTDRGQTWQPSNQGLEGAENTNRIQIFCATVDPHNPNTIWIGTQATGRIYRSTDGGYTWMRMDNGIEPNLGHSFRGFTVDPRSSDIVYAAAEVEAAIFRDTGTRPDAQDGRQGGRVYKTTDGGQNWTLIWEGDALARYVWIDPTNPDTLYVSTGFFDRAPLNLPDGDVDGLNSGGLGVLKSTDGGQTWSILGQERGLTSLHIGSVYMKPDDPQTLLAGAGSLYYPFAIIDGQEVAQGGVYLTTDGGESWRAVVEHEVITTVEYCELNPQIAYAGGDHHVYRSEDGGQTWIAFGDEQRETWGPPGIDPGVPVDIQVFPDNCDHLFINNYVGGNFLSVDGGRTWHNASQGYTGADLFSIAVNPSDARHVFAGSRMAPFVSHDAGQTWEGLTYPGLTTGGWLIALDPSNADHVLFTMESSFSPIFESRDGGKNWQQRLDLYSVLPPGFSEPDWAGIRPGAIAFAPSDSSVVYATTIHMPDDLDMPLPEGWNLGVGIYRSGDGGATWAPANDTNTANLGFGGIAVSPVDPNTAYVGSMFGQGIFKTTDGGTTWMPINQGLPQSYGRFVVLAVDPNQPETVYALSNQGIYKSIDGGSSWTQLAAGLDPFAPYNTIAIDPTNSQIVYVGSHMVGAFYSTDGGRTFQPLTQGVDTSLGSLSIGALALSSDGSALYATVGNRGVYRLGTP
jgi:photosystem II stability/assembly factor-like uncharacterized protein